MPSQCVAWNCTTRRYGDESDDPNTTFHSFPTTRPELLAEWLKCMGEPTWKPQRGSVLCSKHFEKTAFLQNYATPRLKQNAIPVFCEKRPDAARRTLDLDHHANTQAESEAPEAAKRQRKRKVLRKYDPIEEIVTLRQMLEDERNKRRDLEQEIYRLRQEKSEMTAKMTKLEAAKCKPNIPQSIIPILVDAMAKGVDPLKKPDLRPKRPAPATPTQRNKRVVGTATTSPAPAATGGPQKLMLQLPEQILDSNSSKSVSFMVPVSSASTSASTTVADTSQNEVVTVEA